MTYPHLHFLSHLPASAEFLHSTLSTNLRFRSLADRYPWHFHRPTLWSEPENKRKTFFKRKVTVEELNAMVRYRLKLPTELTLSQCFRHRGYVGFFKKRNSTVQKLFPALMTTPLKLLIFQISGEWYRRSWIITEHEDPYTFEHIASDSRTQSKPPTTLSAARAKKITFTGIFLSYRCFLTSLLTQHSGMFKAVKDVLQQP